jgi:hypothetical protein
MTNKNDPVYPIGNDPIASEGLSKREYFAALAMQALIIKYGNGVEVYDNALKIADLIIKKLNENQ